MYKESARKQVERIKNSNDERAKNFKPIADSIKECLEDEKFQKHKNLYLRFRETAIDQMINAAIADNGTRLAFFDRIIAELYTLSRFSHKVENPTEEI